MDIRVINASGLLFVGDPHVSSRSPGRRTDAFVRTVTGKIEQVSKIASERNLIPVCLGDLFDKSRDSNPAMLTPLITAMKLSKHAWWSLVGNHDIHELRITDDTVLAVLSAAGVVNLIGRTGAGFVLETPCGEKTILSGVPYGFEVPDDISLAVEMCGKFDHSIMITHHDFAFGDTYPGAIEPHEVVGCDLAVNGHYHRTRDPVMKGATKWFNPGNITRQTLADVDHVPSVWAWTGDNDAIEQIPLAYVKDVFDLTGRNVDAKMHEEGVMGGSAFVDLLQAETSLEIGRSDSGDMLREDLTAILKERESKPAVAEMVDHLFEMAVLAD